MKNIIISVTFAFAFVAFANAQSAVNISNDAIYSSVYQLHASTYGIAASSSVVKTGSTIIKGILITHADNTAGRKVQIFDSATTTSGISPKVEVDVDAKGWYPLGIKLNTGFFIVNTTTAGVCVIYK